MAQSFRNIKFNIKTKLLLISSAIGIYFCVLFGVYYIQIKSLTQFSEYQNTTEQISAKINQIFNLQHQILIGYSNNSGFQEEELAEKNMNYHLLVDDIENTLTTKFKELEMSDTNFSYTLRKLTSPLQSNDSIFKNMVQIYERIGSGDEGLIKEMNSLSGELIAFSEANFNSHIQVLLLTLFEFDKSFKLQKNLLYPIKFEQTWKQLTDELRSNYSNHPGYSHFEYLLGEYKNYFSIYLNLEKSIGIKTTRGVFSYLSSSQSEIVIAIDHLKQRLQEIRSAEIQRLVILGIIILLLGVICTLWVLRNTSKSLLKPVYQLKNYILDLVKGHLTVIPNKFTFKNEVSEIFEALNKYISWKSRTESFINELISENYHQNYQPLSSTDHLSDSLTKLQEKLKESQEENEKRRQSDETEKWINTGILRISELLNIEYTDTSEFAFSILKEIINYLEVEQGGLFIAKGKGTKVTLELASSIAYNRRKLQNISFKPGEGYVGTSFLEKKPFINKVVPKDYIRITTGLGNTPPNILVIFPCLIDGVVFGILELASLKDLKEKKLTYLERVSSQIAITIARVQNIKEMEKLVEENQQLKLEMENLKEEFNKMSNPLQQ